jgi:hypothetical protein
VEEVGEQLELVVAVAGAELVHRGVHPRVEAEQLGVAVAECADDDGAAVAGVALAGDPAAAFQPVQDAGDGGGVQPGVSCEGAGVEGTVAVDELEAVQVGAALYPAGWLGSSAYVSDSRSANGRTTGGKVGR